jgi:hypothetical protein
MSMPKKKLDLETETVSELTEDQLDKIAGGRAQSITSLSGEGTSQPPPYTSNDSITSAVTSMESVVESKLPPVTD